ncbi:MAG TPA: cation-transporting P-type ATPase [Candidatus Dormibacteraeota bacterium]|nr:cation-transporting P-type ATPase [Candidatus Dormibacteraeota bacterium]
MAVKSNSSPPAAAAAASAQAGRPEPGIEELCRTLKASPGGLTQAEAQSRLSRYGFNEPPEEKANPVLKFLSYFWGPIPWMIEVAAILSVVVHHWEDFYIISAF